MSRRARPAPGAGSVPRIPRDVVVRPDAVVVFPDPPMPPPADDEPVEPKGPADDDAG